MRRFYFNLLCGALCAAAAMPGLAGRVLVPLSAKPGDALILDFDADAQVLFFPQEHDSEDLDWASRLSVLVSQYALATFLKEHPHYEVFAEGALDYAPEHRAKLGLGEIEAIFPGNVLPSSLAALTGKQRWALRTLGAPLTLFSMNLLPRIHAAIPVEEGRALDRRIKAHMDRTGQDFETLDRAGMAIVLDEREAAVERNVMAFLAAHRDRKALIVFGKAHVFHVPGFSYGTVAEGKPAHPDVPAHESKEVAAGAGAAAPGAGAAPGRAGGEGDARTPLMNAVAKRDLALVQRLLREHANVRTQDRLGYNALILAGLEKQLPILEALLEHLAPADVLMPVTLYEDERAKTFEDVIALFEEKNLEKGQDYFEVISRLRAFAAPSSSSSSSSSSSRAPRRAPENPGFRGDLSRFLPPWL